MSNFLAKAKHPVTGKWEEAEFLDDFYGKHEYAVRFSDGYTCPEKDVEVEKKKRSVCCGVVAVPILWINNDVTCWRCPACKMNCDVCDETSGVAEVLPKDEHVCVFEEVGRWFNGSAYLNPLRPEEEMIYLEQCACKKVRIVNV